MRRLILTGLAILATATTVNATEASVTPKKPVIEAVFVLDTTGSMSGLIQSAKEKIWSIASTLGSAQQTPSVKIGLLAYRDRGDSYITKRVELSDNLDRVYEELMKFEAGGGGDGPESVNQALNEAVTAFPWSKDDSTYRVIFLVGDAPPHMDYQDDIRYPDSVRLASSKRIVINTIQCGNDSSAEQPWRDIARIAEGEYARVEQNGGAVLASTPYDDRIAALSSDLEGTRLYYGSAHAKADGTVREERSKELSAIAPKSALAQRAVWNASAAGEANFAGSNELLNDMEKGTVSLDAVAKDELPESIKALPQVEQKAEVAKLLEKRKVVRREIQELSDKRQTFLKERAATTEPGKSLDANLYSTIKKQASKQGLIYEGGPTY